MWTTQLTATGSQLAKFRPDGTKAGEFGSPEPIGGLNGQTARGVAVHPSGVIHVADFRGGVQRYTADGAFIDRYPPDSALPPNGPLSLYIATSAAIDCRGNVYVVNADYPDTARVTVAKFGDPAAEPPPCAPRPLPAGDIDVQVNDVEVTQGVQDLRTFTANRSPAGALAVPDYGNAASYGPTVPLAESRTTVVRAYAALRRGPAGGLANVPATLEATQRIGGVTTHRGPLAPVSQPSVLRVGGTTVDPAQRANPAGAYTFLVPTGWTRGDVDFVVQVNPSHQGCGGACQARSRFQLANVAFRRVAPVTVFPLALTIRPTNVPASYPGALPVMPGVGTLADPGPAFDRARVLSPAPINLFPWVGRVEVGDLVRATSFVEESCFLGIELGLLCTKENKQATREIRDGQVMERIERWVDDNNVSDDVVTMGLISNAHDDLPGAMLHNLKDDDDSPFGYAAVHRPITAVAHELQHALGRAHAGTDLPTCYKDAKDQVGASWPPDEQGFLQGIGLDPRLGSGGGRGPFAVLYPGANGGPGRVVRPHELLREPVTATRGRRPEGGGRSRTSAPPRRPRPPASEPVTSPAWRRPVACCAWPPSPRPTAPSPSAASRPDPARPRPATPGRPSSSRPATPPAARCSHPRAWMPRRSTTAAAPCCRARSRPPAPAMVVVRRAGGDRAVRRVRSANAPRVRLLNPRAGAREGGAGAVTVRWRANDADGDRLVATVQYSANRGRNWRTVHIGGSTGGLRLAGRELAPSRRAQVRVRVDDGFDEAVATSRVFTVLAAPPQARILEPVRGARVREGAPVILRAEASAAGRPLAGRALRWFDRRRALGTGQTLTLPRLDAGRRTIRLVATAGGRRTVRTVAISVAGVRPAFLVLSGPAA